MQIQLRPYQLEAIDAVFSEWDNGNRSTMLSMATGTGKTVVFAQIIQRALKKYNHGVGRALVLAHRDELLVQAQRTIESTTGLRCTREELRKTQIGRAEKVLIGSVQAMCRPQHLDSYLKDSFTVIIIDEAHHALADSYRRILEKFSDALILGVTATPYRGDEGNLKEVFSSLAYEYNIAQGVHDGYLCKIYAQVIPMKIDLSQVKVERGDYVASQVGSALAPHLMAAAKGISEICRTRKTVVFLPLVQTAIKMRDTLISLGLEAREIDGASSDRAETLQWFKEAGKGSVLCNSMLLTEGWDCPSVDCVVVLRATRSQSLYVQMVGRGTRLSPETGKTDLLLLDFLWLTEKYSLCGPADIFNNGDSERSLIKEHLITAGGAIDLERAGEIAEQRLEEELATNAGLTENRKDLFSAESDSSIKLDGPNAIVPPKPMPELFLGAFTKQVHDAAKSREKISPNMRLFSDAMGHIEKQKASTGDKGLSRADAESSPQQLKELAQIRKRNDSSRQQITFQMKSLSTAMAQASRTTSGAGGYPGRTSITTAPQNLKSRGIITGYSNSHSSASIKKTIPLQIKTLSLAMRNRSIHALKARSERGHNEG